jgi:hypothetical protein
MMTKLLLLMVTTTLLSTGCTKRAPDFDHAAVTRLAEDVRNCFERADQPALAKLRHLGIPESGRKNSEEWEQKLMDSGYKVVSWKISRWKQPDWEIFNDYRFSPEPVAIIDMQLRNPEGREHGFFVACAPAGDRYKGCYYVKK